MKVPSSFPKAAEKAGGMTGKDTPFMTEHAVCNGEQLRLLLRRRLGRKTPDWFRPLSFRLQEDSGVLTVSMPHELFFRWYEKRGRSSLEQAVRSLFGNQTSLRYEWPEQVRTIRNPVRLSLSRTTRPCVESDGFDGFLLNGRNKETVLMFRDALHRQPAPLLLRGLPGTGKSHLARAAFQQLKKEFRGQVLFFPGSFLLSELEHTPGFFRQFFKGNTSLVVDDLQFLEKNPEAQRELAAMLDAMTGRAFFIGTLSADGMLIPELYDRLCSYLSLYLPEPDLDIRMRFTQDLMERKGLPENRDTALLLARRCLRLRHLQGVLEHLTRRYEQNGSLPSQDDLESLLEQSGASVPVDVDSILAAVASSCGCTAAQLRENTRNKQLARPRQIAMYLCRRLLGESYPSLGRIFGGKDHSTIMYAVEKIEKLKVTNKDVHILVTKLTKQCANSVPGGSIPF